MKNSHTFVKFVTELVGPWQSRDQLGDNADAFMCILSADALGISVAM